MNGLVCYAVTLRHSTGTVQAYGVWARNEQEAQRQALRTYPGSVVLGVCLAVSM